MRFAIYAACLLLVGCASHQYPRKVYPPPGIVCVFQPTTRQANPSWYLPNAEPNMMFDNKETCEAYWSHKQ